MTKEVKESATYENFMDRLGTEAKPFESFVDITGGNPNAPEKHWVGMPAFDNPEVKDYKKLIVTFETEQDYKDFAKLIKQNLTPKTKSIRFPERDVEDIWSMRWVEDEK